MIVAGRRQPLVGLSLTFYDSSPIADEPLLKVYVQSLFRANHTNNKEPPSGDVREQTEFAPAPTGGC